MARKKRFVTGQVGSLLANLSDLKQAAAEAVSEFLETLSSEASEGVDDAVSQIVDSIAIEHGRETSYQYDASRQRRVFPLEAFDSAYAHYVAAAHQTQEQFERGLRALVEQLLEGIHLARQQLIRELEVADCRTSGLPVVHRWVVVRVSKEGEEHTAISEDDLRLPDLDERVAISGAVYGSPDWPDGTLIVSSLIISAKGSIVETATGWRCALGIPETAYIDWLEGQGDSLDPDEPLTGGPVDLDEESEEDDDEPDGC